MTLVAGARALIGTVFGTTRKGETACPGARCTRWPKTPTTTALLVGDVA
ncbi:hypothetical protein ACFC0C_23510 [Streptomyces sp. NPDC056178]